MTHNWVKRVAYTLGMALLTVPSVRSQNTSLAGGQQVVDERSEIAEAIIARQEAASGRAFDPAYRAQVKADLALRSPDELATLEKRGFGLLPGPNVLGSASAVSVAPNVLGSSSADLVFNPVPPCRIIDTRLTVAGPIAGGSTRNFLAAGSGFASQGGVAGSCGVPFGPATAVAVNLTAVPTAPGDMRAFPFPATAPLASVLNYTTQNIANMVNLKICDPSVSSCGSDFTVQADGNAVDLVGDVMGYFAKPATSPVGVCGTNDVSFGGHCYYLDGSRGVCDPGYALASQSALSTIASSFVGLNYKHTVSNNCCIYNVDPVENWGMAGHCNVAGPFTAGEPVLGGTGCNGATNLFSAQLTLCGK